MHSFEKTSIAFYDRTLAKYEQFFAFQVNDYIGKGILDIAAGCASFTAEASRRGIDAVAVDPLYTRSVYALTRIGRMDLDTVIARAERTPEKFDLNILKDFEGLRVARENALNRFADDYEAGLATRRYLAASLPLLPFPERQFDHVLCGHFLFLYADRLNYQFHLDACRELCRVCRGEVRLYPLVDLDIRPCPFLDRLIEELERYQITAEIRETDYNFLHGCNQVMILRNK